MPRSGPSPFLDDPCFTPRHFPGFSVGWGAVGHADPGHYKSHVPLFEPSWMGRQDVHTAAVCLDGGDGWGIGTFLGAGGSRYNCGCHGRVSVLNLFPSLLSRSTHRLVSRTRGGASNEKDKDSKIQGPCIGIDLGTTYSCVAVR